MNVNDIIKHYDTPRYLKGIDETIGYKLDKSKIEDVKVRMRPKAIIGIEFYIKRNTKLSKGKIQANSITRGISHIESNPLYGEIKQLLKDISSNNASLDLLVEIENTKSPCPSTWYKNDTIVRIKDELDASRLSEIAENTGISKSTLVSWCEMLGLQEYSLLTKEFKNEIDKELKCFNDTLEQRKSLLKEKERDNLKKWVLTKEIFLNKN